MATSSRQSALFGVNDWQRIYQTYRQADFQSYDFETIRKSFIDYLTTYYPETFNDYIESSEFIALLDVMAFMGQSLAFRGDLNARENFIDTAERRDSVIKLANLVAYTPKRNIAGSGVVKVTAISTTEQVYDINGINLSNLTVLWNDPANPSWQEQFNAIINATLVNSQRIGRPGNSENVLGVKTDEYTINLTADRLPVIPFSTTVDDIFMNFELTSSTATGQTNLYEPPPAPNSQMNILYRNDKLGYGSPNTGFFFYFKQGLLQTYDFSFFESIQNNFQLINVEGINNTDTWLYQLNPTTNAIQYLWEETENIYINANPQGTSSRKVFSVNSRSNDQVTYVFGDGVFGEIPVGNFRAYVRSSNSLTYTIDPSEMQGIVVTLPYISRNNTVETLTFTFSLQTSVSTALARESIASIKERAPTRYYTQNRMVNGEDYTNFPFTFYNNIIKSKAVNRSSVGTTRNLDLLDPTGKYGSTNVFADDGAIYRSNVDATNIFSPTSTAAITEYLSVTLPTLLADDATLQYYFGNYPRYDGTSAAGTYDGGQIKWKSVSIGSSSITGYFYVNNSPTNEIVISIGGDTDGSPKYLTKNSLVKFLPPTGYYFDANNRLQLTPTSGVPSGGKTFLWAGIVSVYGDGDGNGTGLSALGVGTITLNTYVPSGAIIDPTDGIIPSFDNTFSNTLVRDITTKIAQRETFALQFDNSYPITNERWILLNTVPSDTTRYFIKFMPNSIDSNYTVYIHALTYYFGSVEEVRFIEPSPNPVYDPRSGQFLSDFVNVLKINNSPTFPSPPSLGSDYYLNVVGQKVESDGYPDDYSVTVSTINQLDGFSSDPDFFADIVGTVPSTPSASSPWVFFQTVIDGNGNSRLFILPANFVISGLATESAVLNVVTDYPAGTLFYAYTDAKFYQSSEIPASVPPVLTITDVTSDYSALPGRGGLDFQYRHNSSDTTRIDPGTTNIIDLYLVTQAYYAAYQNWLKDTTDTVPLPSKPTTNDLQAAYGELDSYKMLSDSVVMNSVVFKPLFGTKAAYNLQGTIKVVKNPSTTVSDSVIRTSVLSAMNTYFTIDKWDFGDTFYMSELTAYLHSQLGELISSVVLVSANPNQTFGDLYQIESAPYEIFVNGATANDIVIIAALTPQALQR